MSGSRPVVAVVTDAILPYNRGGKEARTDEILRRIATRAEVHVYTMKWWDGARIYRRDGVTYHPICRRVPLYHGDRRSIRQAALFAVACLRLLGARFTVLDADCIPHLHLYVLRLVATLRRRRLVVTWHEVWGEDYWRRYLGRRGRIAWWIERSAMRLPDEIIAVSDETRDRLLTYVGHSVPVTVAANGIDLGAVRAAPVSDDRVTLVVVGRLLANKRVDLLLEAVGLLHARGRPVTCRVIGEGPERDALRARAERLGIADAVAFRDDVADQTTLYSLVKASDIFVFPSEREGFGIAVLEALACGVPVVTTSAPDNFAAGLVRDSGAGIVTEPTAQAIAEAVATILDAPRRMHAPDAWLHEFDWDVVADRALEALMAGGGARRTSLAGLGAAVNGVVRRLGAHCSVLAHDRQSRR